jgi:hypothetical protein
MKGQRLGKVSSLVLTLGSLVGLVTNVSIAECKVNHSQSSLYQLEILADTDFSYDAYIAGSLLGLSVMAPFLVAGYFYDKKNHKKHSL